MKNMKKLIFVFLLIVAVLSFNIIAKADNAYSLKVIGDGITQDGTSATTEAAPGEDVTFNLAVITSNAFKAGEIPWNFNSISDKLTIKKITAQSNMGIQYRNSSRILDKIGFFSNEGIATPVDGAVNIISMEFTVSNSFSSNEHITLKLGKDLSSGAVVVYEDSNGKNTEAPTTGVSLTINYKSTTPDPGDSQDLGYGITKPADEPTVSNFDVKPTITNGGLSGVGYPVIKFSKVTTGAQCYLYRSTNATSSFVKVATVDCSSAATYTDTNARIPVGTSATYYYRARVVGGTKISDYISFTVGGPSVIDPITDPGDGEEIAYGILFPDNETENTSLPKPDVDSDKPKVTDTTSTITFDVGDAEGQCVIYRSTKEDSDFIEIKTIECKGKTTYTDTDLKPDTTYYYRIRMVGSKKISDAIIVKTLATSSSTDKNGEVGPGGTGAITPVIAVIGLAGAFIFIKKYYNDNSIFSRI